MVLVLLPMMALVTVMAMTLMMVKTMEEVY
jgi:hypothetical protein